MAFVGKSFPAADIAQVLSEVRQPRKTFPRAVLVAINIAASLFLLVNAAFVRTV